MQPMWKRSIALAVVLLLALTMLVPYEATAQGPKKGSLTTPLLLPIPGGGTLPATLTITQFERGTTGGIVAVGTVAATQLTGATAHSAVQAVRIPVTNITSGASSAGITVQQVGCDILNLELGPLDLNLLGLTIHLDQVVLDIVAVPGAGNLLGNLLCAIAGLLDGPFPPLGGLLNQIINLLNQILAAL